MLLIYLKAKVIERLGAKEMKLKYYMRGLGIGMILTTLILSIGGTKERLTDQEIMDRAKTLGMVVEDEKDKNLDHVLAEINQSVTPAPVATIAPTVPPANTPTVVPATVTPLEPTKQPTPEPTKTPISKPAAKSGTSDKTQSKGQTEEEKITFTINKGMTSERVAALLEEKKLINNAADFDQYIINVGKARKIKVGTYTFYKGTSYSDIVSKITRKQ